MPEIRTYSVQEASQLTGISKPALRAYTNRTEYRHILSTYATPEKKGIERKFTEPDLHLLAFIYAHTRPSVGETHEQVAERLAAGELEQFTWAPLESPSEPQEEATAGSTALVPIESLRLAQALAAEAQRREQQAKEEAERRVQEAQARADALQAEVQRLTGELGRAEGKLSVYEQQAQQAQPVPRKRPKWLISLFGE